MAIFLLEVRPQVQKAISGSSIKSVPPPHTQEHINKNLCLWKIMEKLLQQSVYRCPQPSPPHPQNKINHCAAFDAERCCSIPRHDRESGPYRSSSHISHWLFTLLVKKALKGFGAKIYFWSAASFINIQIASKSSRTEPLLCPRSQKWNSREGCRFGRTSAAPLNFWPKMELYLEN